MKPLKVLFFINGPVPTKSQLADAAGINAQVAFRNAQYVLPVTDKNFPPTTEAADAVMGEVPELYQGFPTVDEAVEIRETLIKESLKDIKEEAAPVKPVAAAKTVKTEKASKPAPAPVDKTAEEVKGEPQDLKTDRGSEQLEPKQQDGQDKAPIDTKLTEERVKAAADEKPPVPPTGKKAAAAAWTPNA